MINNMLSNFFSGSSSARYRTEGKVSYLVEPIETKGRLPYNTCSITIKAYPNAAKEVQLPIKIKWYRMQAERNYEIEELENVDHYNFSAMDIGGEIKVSVRSMDENHKGTVSLIFGPIKFDEILRPPLENVLLSGFSKFNAMVQEDDSLSPDKVQPISLFMSPNQIKFYYYTGSEEESFYVEITSEKPRFEIVYREPDNLVLYFDDVGLENQMQVKKKIYRECESAQEQFFIHLRFFSASSRDIFLTAIRLFRIVPVFALSNLFRQIDVLLRENRLFESNSKISLNELLVEYDMIRTTLLSTIEYAKDLDKDREELQECVSVLERDLEHTMTQFKKYIEENFRNGSLMNKSASDNLGVRPEVAALRKIDELNASLLSNRGEMKSVIKKKLDESNPQILEKAKRTQTAQAGAAGGLTVSLAEYQELQKKLQHETTLKDMFQKKIKEIESKVQKKKQVVKEMSKHMANVSKEIFNIKEETSRMHSQMFDVSLIEPSGEGEDLLVSDAFDLAATATKKPSQFKSPGHSNLFKIDEQPEKPSSDAARLELRVKEEEVQRLKSKIVELEKTILEQKSREALESRKPKPELSAGRAEELQRELDKLRSREAELKQEADKSLKFIEEFRRLIKAAIAEDEPNLKAPMNSSLIDESLMNDVFKVNLNTKLKMVDLENDSLKKRITSLTKEVYLLREETRELKTQGSKAQQPVATGASKEELEAVKKQNDGLLGENENLRRLLDRMKNQEEELSSGAGSVVQNLKRELAELTSVNQNLLVQKQELARRNEQIRSQAQSQGEKKDEAEERRDKIIIEQLSKTNERMMIELNKLQEKIAAYEDARMSFISDVNDSYMSQSVRGSGLKNRFN